MVTDYNSGADYGQAVSETQASGPSPDQVVEALAHVTAALDGGGEERPGQVEMARAVAATIASGRSPDGGQNGGHLLVQAGTGTGKSLAYLVPAVLSGRRVVVSTATKALQDQIAERELPHLARQLERNFSWAVLKGRSNYICRQRVDEIANDAQLSLAGMASPDTDEIERLVEFSDLSRTGDRAELDFEPADASWAAVSVTSRECPGRGRCPSGEVCFTEAARDRAAASDVVVVNTHLLGLDLATEGAILPEHEVVVVDEAHQIEEIATSTFGWTINAGRLRWFARTVDRILDDPTTTDALRDVGDDLTDALDPLVDTRLGAPTGAKEAVLAAAIDRARDRVNEAVDLVRNLPKGPNIDAEARAARAMRAGETLLGELVGAAQVCESHVAWVDRPGGEPTLNVAPLDVSALLGPSLFVDRTVILTSATLAPTISTAVGLDDEDFTRLDVDSPFDYQANALLYCATQLPEPRSPAYQEAMLAHLGELIEAAGGRTLALFTSWRMMDAALEYLQDQVETPLLTQRDLPKPALIQAFSAAPEVSLLATLGFWQGIDVPGPSLSLVTIDRLPFPRPDDPLLSARRELAGRHAFRLIDLPRAATLMAQGAGRLIRSIDDTGVVAVLDSRLATKKSYRWDLIAAMPPFARTSDPDLIKARLREIAKDAGSDPASSAGQ